MTENSKKKHLKNQQLEDIAMNDNMSKEAFPWLPEFNKTIHSSVGSRNYQHLEQLLSLYRQNILSSTAESSIEFSDTINIKNHISNMLIFFHLYWLDIKQDIADHSLYLNRMSALLNIYIDMELETSMEKKTSSHVKDSSEIAAKILAALYVYLNNSKEHIFKVLLRIKYATEKYTKVCDHLFTKSLTNLTIKTMPITDIAYIRYLLAFKMWKKMEKDTDNKKRIDKLALMLLGPRMPKLIREELSEFVPKSPVNKKNDTFWLLQPNVFDLKRAHEHFLLFEDKMDNSADLQYIKAINADQNCSISQKCQANSLFGQSNSNEGAFNREVKNKNHLNSLPNNNIASSNNGNKSKSMDQNYLQKKKGTTSFKRSLKKMRKKSEGTIIDLIDLTSKIKRKKVKPNILKNLKYLRIMKKKHRSQKHINDLKYLSQLVDVDIQSASKDGRNSDDKVLLKCKPIPDNQISDKKNCTLISCKSLLNDVARNLQKNESSSITKDHNICPVFMKEDEMQHDYTLYYTKTSKFVDQDTKELKAAENVLKKDKPENISSHVLYATANTVDSYNNPIMQNKEELTSQENNAMETIPLFKMCQNSIMDENSFKQELLTSTNCSAIQKSQHCSTMMQKCKTLRVNMQDITHIIKNLKFINDHSSQITDILKQNVCHQGNECPNHCAKVDCKLLVTSNDVVMIKARDTLHDTFNQKGNDIKLACENTNIINMLNDRNKCVFVNHIGEHVAAEKSTQCLDKSNDVYTVSTMFTGDQIEPLLYNQHVGFDNSRTNDYGNATKYFENTMNEQQGRNNCDNSMSNDQTHSSESCTFDFNSFEVGSNTEVAYESQVKNFPKIEDNEIMKADCIGDLENISSLNKLQSETLKDVLQQFSETSQINCDNTTGISSKKLPGCINSDVNAMKTHDTLHMFNNDEKDLRCKYNLYIKQADKCVVADHTDEHLTITNTDEKKMQCLDNTSDVSTMFIVDQGNTEQHWKKRMLSSEFSTFINIFEIDSKEASEIMKTDCTDDLEICFLHNIGSMEEILEDVRHQPSLMSEMNYDNSSSVSKDVETNIFSIESDDTVDFLPLEQSSLDSLYCNALSDAPDDSRTLFLRGR